MKKKIIGVLVCMLVIATVIPISTSTTDDKPNNIVDENESVIGTLPLAPYYQHSEEYVMKQKDSYTKSPLNRGWNWLPSYPNYAPSGIPDFYQKQSQWKSIVDGGNGIAESTAVGDDVQVIPVGQPVVDPLIPYVVAPGLNCALDSTHGGDDREMWMFCAAVATANCFWWLDSKYDDPDGFPGDGEDDFLLVEDYGTGDDHATANALLLIENLARATNITQNGYNYFDDWLDAIENWFTDAGLEDLFEVNFYTVPTFDFIAGEIEQGKSVILVVYLGKNDGGQCVLLVDHAFTCAGVNLEEQKIAICDPYWDIEDPGGPSHNDAQYVSYDIYDVAIGSPCPNYPEVKWWLLDYWPYYDFALPYYAYIIDTNNEPPNAPSISGKLDGKVNKEYEYTFNAVDIDTDEVKFFIDWGDGSQQSTDFITSGTDIKLMHKWDTKGTYNITAKAQDTNGFYSLRGTLKVSMPFSYNIPFVSFWERLFERFPHAFPILQRLLGY